MIMGIGNFAAMLRTSSWVASDLSVARKMYAMVGMIPNMLYVMSRFQIRISTSAGMLDENSTFRVWNMSPPSGTSRLNHAACRSPLRFDAGSFLRQRESQV
jgi:hypothetical protein